jgi:hypothetical protein
MRQGMREMGVSHKQLSEKNRKGRSVATTPNNLGQGLENE